MNVTESKPKFRELFKDWLIDIFTTLLEIVEYYMESLYLYYKINENKDKIEQRIFQNKKLQIYWIYILYYISSKCDIYVTKNEIFIEGKKIDSIKF